MDPVNWFQLYVYRDRGATEALVRRIEVAGCTALVLTVDGERGVARIGHSARRTRPGDGVMRLRVDSSDYARFDKRGRKT